MMVHVTLIVNKDKLFCVSAATGNDFSCNLLVFMSVTSFDSLSAPVRQAEQYLSSVVNK